MKFDKQTAFMGATMASQAIPQGRLMVDPSGRPHILGVLYEDDDCFLMTSEMEWVMHTMPFDSRKKLFFALPFEYALANGVPQEALNAG